MAKLTNLGVGINTVGPVMECAAEMFGYTLNAIPSARTVGKSPFLSQYFIQEQLRRVIVDARTKGIATTSCSDETKKNGFVWQNYLLRIIDI
uniref:Uncharacterized protein n=1 Tax=Panagrolaimus davidi TaxID=227884 RepID=A0A914QYV2_9BILA